MVEPPPRASTATGIDARAGEPTDTRRRSIAIENLTPTARKPHAPFQKVKRRPVVSNLAAVRVSNPDLS
jgi:hypothetical protein